MGCLWLCDASENFCSGGLACLGKLQNFRGRAIKPSSHIHEQASSSEEAIPTLASLVADRVAIAGVQVSSNGHSVPPAATRSPPAPLAVPRASPGLGVWAEGDAQSFRLRCGPDYRQKRLKETPGPPLYRCVSAEVVEAQAQIRSCTASFSSQPTGLNPESEARSGSSQTHDLASIGLPNVIVVNFQLPFCAGPWLKGQHPKEDHGCSVLLFFQLQAMPDMEIPAAARLLARYLHEEGHPKKEGQMVSGCFKAIGVLEDLDQLNITAAARPIMRQFNGKPVLVERETRRYAFGTELVELAIDVRGFNPVARSLLQRLRGQLPVTSVQLGLLVQGCSDAELPEGFLGSVQLRGLDLLGGRRVTASAAEVDPTAALSTAQPKPTDLGPSTDADDLPAAEGGSGITGIRAAAIAAAAFASAASFAGAAGALGMIATAAVGVLLHPGFHHDRASMASGQHPRRTWLPCGSRRRLPPPSLFSSPGSCSSDFVPDLGHTSQQPV
ncbi:unnamed protein product [Polarella glacialis]|uniref:Protein ENHANCED DISEASE RESISTANCE 2 C-terminal domain-containing protein n=2 Tax=Polarella glacialis TaxID=89957 RepID=A0A813J7G9_POLGL|nr:unnamed protein product [Polarella glacialis]